MSGRHKEKQKKSSFDAHKILVNKEMSDIEKLNNGKIKYNKKGLDMIFFWDKYQRLVDEKSYDSEIMEILNIKKSDWKERLC